MILCANLNVTTQKVLNILYMLTVLSQILSTMTKKKKKKIVGVDVYTIYLLVELAKPWSCHKSVHRVKRYISPCILKQSTALAHLFIYSFPLFK